MLQEHEKVNVSYSKSTTVNVNNTSRPGKQLRVKVFAAKIIRMILCLAGNCHVDYSYEKKN